MTSEKERAEAEARVAARAPANEAREAAQAKAAEKAPRRDLKPATDCLCVLDAKGIVVRVDGPITAAKVARVRQLLSPLPQGQTFAERTITYDRKWRAKNPPLVGQPFEAAK